MLISRKCGFNYLIRASEMGQEAKALAAKPDDLNLIPKIHIEEKNELPRAALSLPHILCVMSAPRTLNYYYFSCPIPDLYS